MIEKKKKEEEKKRKGMKKEKNKIYIYLKEVQNQSKQLKINKQQIGYATR